MQTLKQNTIDSVCMSYRHDFGLLPELDKASLRRVAVGWLEAWQKEGLSFPSSTPRDPATPADKYPADMVPVAFRFRYDDPEHGGFEFYDTVPNPPQKFTSRQPLYGPEAAERIAALEAEIGRLRERNNANAEHARLANANFALMDKARAANKARAETAEARVKELEARNNVWPDYLQSPQAEAIRNGKIDHTEIISLFDKLERELVELRQVAALAQKEGEKNG